MLGLAQPLLAGMAWSSWRGHHGVVIMAWSSWRAQHRNGCLARSAMMWMPLKTEAHNELRTLSS